MKKGISNRPWLTIILDDYSRAVASYYLSFSALGIPRGRGKIERFSRQLTKCF